MTPAILIQYALLQLLQLVGLDYVYDWMVMRVRLIFGDLLTPQTYSLSEHVKIKENYFSLHWVRINSSSNNIFLIKRSLVGMVLSGLL